MQSGINAVDAVVVVAAAVVVVAADTVIIRGRRAFL